jgi:proteasome accessory factor B
MPDDVFGNSLGVNTGPPSHVEIAFDKRVAPYVRTRVWHPSQSLKDAADGSIVLSMEVCNDLALRSWILGWGASARVLSPAALANDIRSDLKNATAQYN